MMRMEEEHRKAVCGKPHARFDEGKEEEIPPTYSTFIQHYFHTEPNEKAASPDGVGAF